ncbi:MAG: hypothetical protein IPL96_11710 [Holophagaceae bacterium]|nr:hypothetical protein [Holophagaceae bacterium]
MRPSRPFLVRLLLTLALALPAAAQARWQYLRTEVSDAQAKGACAGEVVRAEAAGFSGSFEHSVPAGCNQGRAWRAVHAHGWSRLAEALKAGEAPDFSTMSLVKNLSGSPAPYDGSSVTAGFVPFDAAPGQAPDGKSTLAKSGVENQRGVDFMATDSHLARFKPFRMPQGPWQGSERHGQMIRFRVLLAGGGSWHAVDRIYQWTTGPAATAATSGGWRFVKAETFDSPVWNGPNSPLKNPSCGEETIKADVTANAVIYDHAMPAACNSGKAWRSVHAHGWSKLADLLPAGEAPELSLRSTIQALNGPVPSGEATQIIAGFVPFDAPGDVAPAPSETLARLELANRQGAGFLASESHLKRAQPLKLPEGPWLNSAQHGGMVRFRVFLKTGTIWRSVDRVYQWSGK